MKENQQSKEYKTPNFQLVRTDESNKVFFAASEPAPGPKSVGATLQGISAW